jgi:hypothetical protein
VAAGVPDDLPRRDLLEPDGDAVPQSDAMGRGGDDPAQPLDGVGPVSNCDKTTPAY